MNAGAAEENYGGNMAAEPLERTYRSRKVGQDDANRGDGAGLPTERVCCQNCDKFNLFHRYKELDEKRAVDRARQQRMQNKVGVRLSKQINCNRYLAMTAI